MIIFETTIGELNKNRNNIDYFDGIEFEYKEKLKRRPGSQERISWQNSLRALSSVMSESNIPEDVILLIEFTIPISGSRIDAVICSKDASNSDVALIIELKQWEIASASTIKRMVKTNVVGNNLMEHPSAQVINYRNDLKSIDNSFSKVILRPSSFLHNYVNQDINGLKDVRYSEYIKEAPLFEQNSINDMKKYLIENTAGGPSKFVYEVFKNMTYNPSISLRENAKKFSNDITRTFDNITLYGDQTSAFNIIKENIIASENKNLFLIRGAAGTGKTILAIKLFLELSQKMPTALFFPGSDFRQIISDTFSLKSNKQIFGGRVKGMPTRQSSLNSKEFSFGIIDEAHKLPWQSSFSGVEPLIDIINKIDNNLVLYDETQVVSYKSIDTLENALKEVKRKKGCQLIELDLKNQFRSLGGNNFINFIDNIFYKGIVTEFVPEKLSLKVCDDEHDFIDMYINNNDKNKRLLSLASSFPWTKKIIDGLPFKDIKIANHKFNWYFPVGATVRRNFLGYNELSSKQKSEIQLSINDDKNCLDYIAYHNTVQGSEFNHVSIIVGEELILQNGRIILDFEKIPKGSRAAFKSPKGLKGTELNRINGINTKIALNQLKVLLTRARKSINIYFKDQSLNDFFKSLIINK